MKKLFLLVLTLFIYSSPLLAQGFKLIGMNTLSGAITGSAIGGATMLITNDFDNYRPLSIGFGTGTIAGLGLGVYDITTNSSEYSGVFNSSSETSGQLILTDTFYGTLTGALVGFAVTLISEDKLVDGLRVGAGFGAYSGLVFGIVDAFIMNNMGTGGGGGYGLGSINFNQVNGIVQYEGSVINAGYFSQNSIANHSNGSIKWHPALSVAHFKVSI